MWLATQTRGFGHYEHSEGGGRVHEFAGEDTQEHFSWYFRFHRDFCDVHYILENDEIAHDLVR